MFESVSSYLKSVFSKAYTKYLLLGVIFLVIMIVVAVPLFPPKTSKVVNNPPSSAKRPMANKSSESLDQLNSPITSTGPIKVMYNLPVKQPVVFITIDDGWYPNEEVLKLMRQYHLPITTFLIEQAARKHPDYWHQFVNAGGHIEDHTVDHPFMTHLSAADQKKEISQPVDYLRQYCSPIDEFRPPYGDYNCGVGQAAKDSGMKYVVLWNAEMKNTTLETRNGPGLKSGDIILLHWVPGLDQELLKLLNIIQKQNLGVADLTQALNGETLNISWLKTPIPVPNTGASKPVGNSHDHNHVPRPNANSRT